MPAADTVRTPGTFGISAWLHRSEARRHLRCRWERTGRDPRCDRQRGHASPCPRHPVAAGEGLGSCHSSGHATFPPRGHARHGSGVVTLWLSKCLARLAACHHCEHPSSPPASRTSRIPASCNPRHPGPAVSGLLRERLRPYCPGATTPGSPARSRWGEPAGSGISNPATERLRGRTLPADPAVHGARPRIRPIPRADSSDFAKNPAAGLSAISSV